MTNIYMYATGGTLYPNETLHKTFLKQILSCGGGRWELGKSPQTQKNTAISQAENFLHSTQWTPGGST